MILNKIKLGAAFSLAGALFVSSGAEAKDTPRYDRVSEIKAFDDYVAVYFDGGLKHECGETHDTRFLVAGTEEHKVSILMASWLAGKVVSLQYSCDKNGHPWVTGVRAK